MDDFDPNSAMTRDEALEALRRTMPNALIVRDLSLDADGYWTARVEAFNGALHNVSMPDWYPDGATCEYVGEAA